MIYENEIFEKINVGDRRKAYVKQNREDGKLDLSLTPIGQSRDVAYDKVLSILELQKELPLNTKSDVDEIKKLVGVSKKAFKSVVNRLKSEEKIEVNEDGVRLI
jgi:predicted RNA-binding protein (virulence factor B family)